jgi:hypothetical protein
LWGDLPPPSSIPNRRQPASATAQATPKPFALLLTSGGGISGAAGEITISMMRAKIYPYLGKRDRLSDLPLSALDSVSIGSYIS